MCFKLAKMVERELSISHCIYTGTIKHASMAKYDTALLGSSVKMLVVLGWLVRFVKVC